MRTRIAYTGSVRVCEPASRDVAVACGASDAELLRRVAARDIEAGSALVDRYAGELMGFLLRRVPSQEAEDLLQEVFARALRSASRFRFESSVRTWLYGITRHVLLARDPRRHPMGSLADLIDPAHGPESLAIQAQRRRRAIAALETLPDEQAVVLELHRVDQLSHEVIAEMLDISPAASRKRLQRAAESLGRARPDEGARLPVHSRIESWRRSLLRRTLG